MVLSSKPSIRERKCDSSPNMGLCECIMHVDTTAAHFLHTNGLTRVPTQILNLLV